ncbi:MAG: hypothetical protein J6Q39_12835 [Bacteroidales bacterium]|nr:hypothetical protein [Bacteroidales bacterium]
MKMKERYSRLKSKCNKDWCITILIVIVLLMSFFVPEQKNMFTKWLMNIVYFGVGIGAFIYIYYAVRYLFNMIELDLLWIKNKFLHKVVNLVMLVPFAIMMLFVLCNGVIPNLWKKYKTNEKYSTISECQKNFAKELIFAENLYDQDNITIDVENIDTLFDNHNKQIAKLTGWELVKKDSVSYCYVKSVDKLPKDIVDKSSEEPSLFWSVYYHYIDPGNQHIAPTENGRRWAAVIAILGYLLLNGLLVAVLIGWFDRRRESWEKGMVKYNPFFKRKEHYVIIGGNDMVIGIVKQLTKEPSYIIILTSRDVESFRRELFSELTEEQKKYIVIYYGNRTSRTDIEYLGLEATKELYILGEETRTDDIESYHDTMNMECLQIVSEVCSSIDKFVGDKAKLLCNVMFEYQTTFNIYQTTDVYTQKIDFRPFNYYEAWAQNVLVCREMSKEKEDEKKYKYLPLEGIYGIKADDDNFVHLIIIGMSRMGIALAIEAAHLSHYPNFETQKKRTRITLIDPRMEQEMLFFKGRFEELFSVSRCRYIGDFPEKLRNEKNESIYYDEKYLWENPLMEGKTKYTPDDLGGDFVDVEWEFINGSIESLHVREYMKDASGVDNAKITIAVCLPENNRSIASAAYLPKEVIDSKNVLQILVYQRKNDVLVNNISKTRYSKLKAFGMSSNCYDCSLDELFKKIGDAISKSYDEYMFGCTVERYKGNGMIEDDYSKLYGELKEEDKKAEIKKKYNDWMKQNSNDDYNKIVDSLKSLKESIEEEYKLKCDNGNKPKSAKLWSNKYNMLMMWSKFRCVDISEGELSDEDKDIVAKVEHNRWNIEQLLLKYSPLTHIQQLKAQRDSIYSSCQEKDNLKKQFSHLDICSNEKLDLVDHNLSTIDKKLTETLFDSYKKYIVDKKNDAIEK